MRFAALATDYDETLADHGRVLPGTEKALERLRTSGRKLLLVTGRDLKDLLQVFPRVDLFHAVVAENGALLYLPDRKQERPLAEPPPERFAAALRRAGVPLTTGRVIVATRVPHETAVLEEIKRQGLELQVIFNKGAVMVLPSGVNKGTGLKHALAELRLSPHNAVAVGAKRSSGARGRSRCSRCLPAPQRLTEPRPSRARRWGCRWRHASRRSASRRGSAAPSRTRAAWSRERLPARGSRSGRRTLPDRARTGANGR